MPVAVGLGAAQVSLATVMPTDRRIDAADVDPRTAS
jgi:hypothetical protein